MVFSRSEVKRRTKESHDPLGENPKRTKVHAQRKFAQGSGMNSPIMTPIKEKEKNKPNNTPSPAELLPSKRPATEDFLSFLCFRGTNALPPRLDYFNEASNSERPDNVPTNSSKQSSNTTSGTRKIKSRNSDPQIFKKNLAERRSGLQKGNAMRARTASDERQVLRKTRIERQLRRKAAQRRAKTIRKTHPSILKRLGANRLRAGLRSGGQLPPGSEVGLKTDRKPKRGRPKRIRKKKKMAEAPQKQLKREEDLDDENEEDENTEEEKEEDEDEDEEEEDAEEVEKPVKRSSMPMRTRGASNSPANTPKKQSISSRPSRKTKEAATLYMEMLTKDLRNPDEEFDDDYVRSFPELPSSVKKEKEEDVAHGSPKRGKLSSLPNKGGKLKGTKTLKTGKTKEEIEEGEDDYIDNEPLLKRSQRLQVKKVSPKKANSQVQTKLKVKKIQNTVKSSKKDLVKKREYRKRELNTTSSSVNDDDDEEAAAGEELIRRSVKVVKKVLLRKSKGKDDSEDEEAAGGGEELVKSSLKTAKKALLRKSIGKDDSEDEEAAAGEEIVRSSVKTAKKALLRKYKGKDDSEDEEIAAGEELVKSSVKIAKKALLRKSKGKDDSEDEEVAAGEELVKSSVKTAKKALLRKPKGKDDSEDEEAAAGEELVKSSVKTIKKALLKKSKGKDDSEDEEAGAREEFVKSSVKTAKKGFLRKSKGNDDSEDEEAAAEELVRSSVKTAKRALLRKSKGKNDSEDEEAAAGEEIVKSSVKTAKKALLKKSKAKDNSEVDSDDMTPPLSKTREHANRKNKNKDEGDEEDQYLNKNRDSALKKNNDEMKSDDNDDDYFKEELNSKKYKEPYERKTKDKKTGAIEEDDNDEEDEYVNSSSERKDKKPFESNTSKGRWSKRIDQKKNDAEQGKGIGAKKRKSVPASGSDDSAVSDEENDDIVPSSMIKKTRRSVLVRGVDQRKSKKSVNDDCLPENTSKRGSTRNTKKEVDESECEDFDVSPKEKPFKRPKKSTNESDEEVVTRGRPRGSKYKDDSDEEKLESPKKLRGSLQRKAKNKEDAEEVSEKNARKPLRTQPLRAKRKEESEEEFEEYSDKEKLLLQKRTKNKLESVEDVESISKKLKGERKARNRSGENENIDNLKKGVSNQRKTKDFSDNEIEIVQGKRESSLKKVKYTDDSDEDLESRPSKKLRESFQRRAVGKVKEESDEEVIVPHRKVMGESDEEPIFHRKPRLTLQRKVKSKEESDEEAVISPRKLRGFVHKMTKDKSESDEDETLADKLVRSSIKPVKRALLRKSKAKYDSEEDSDELHITTPNKITEHSNRMNKNKSEGDEEDQSFKTNRESTLKKKNDEFSSDDEDDKEALYYKKGSELNAMKIKNKEQEEVNAKRKKTKGQLKTSKDKFENDNENDSQIKNPKDVFQKEAKDKIEIQEHQRDDKELQKKKELVEEEALSEKGKADEKFSKLPDDKNAQKEDQSAPIAEEKVDKEKGKSSSCEGEEKSASNLNDLVHSHQQDRKLKKNIVSGQNKKKPDSLEHNVKDVHGKEIVKKRKKKIIANKNEIKEERSDELTIAKSKFESVNEEIGETKEEFSIGKSRPNIKAKETDDNESRKQGSFDKEPFVDPPEFHKVHQKSKKALRENFEGDAPQRVRVLPRRGARKAYEESDEEFDHSPLKGSVQRKQPFRKSTKNTHYDDYDYDDDDYKSRLSRENSSEKELQMFDVTLEKKIGKPILALSDKIMNEDETKIKSEIEETFEAEQTSALTTENPLSDNLAVKIKNETNLVGSELENMASAHINIEEKESRKKAQEKEYKEGITIEKNSVELISKNKALMKCDTKLKKMGKLDISAQDSKRDGNLSKLKKVQIDDNRKNLQEALSQNLTKEQCEKSFEKTEVDPISDDQKTGNKKPKMPLYASPETTKTDKNKEERIHRSIRPFSQVEKEGLKGNYANLAISEGTRENSQFKKTVSSGIVSDEIISKKGPGIDIRKQKKNSYDIAPSDVRKSKDAAMVLKKSEDKVHDIYQKKSKDDKYPGTNLTSEDKMKSKRITRYSIGSNEDKVTDKANDNEKHFAGEEKTVSDIKPARISLRKPSLTAHAQMKKEDDSKLSGLKINDGVKNPAPIKRKSLGDRESIDSGSSGITDCKVVIKSLGNISGDSLMLPSKRAKTEDKNDSGNFSGEASELERSPLKSKPSVGLSTTSSGSDNTETEKTDDKKEIIEKQKSKQSINETWRQAFKNARIPKPGHLSPVPRTVKPFVRQKIPGSSFLGGSFQAKNQDGSDQKAHDVNTKPKVPSNLSPFKSLIANQTQRSSSPDAKRHLSPAHKTNFMGFESPIRKSDEVKNEIRKYEAPVKSLTQLQYEKRSSEFISSLDSGPSLLPGFESIRAYKKELKKEEPKEVLKTETSEVPQISEPTVKPSPEGKHLNLPLAVEHTLRKMSPITVSKKPPVKLVQAKTDSVSINKVVLSNAAEKRIEMEPSAPQSSGNANTSLAPAEIVQPSSTNMDMIVRDQSDLSFMAKKKVNMTNEEINRWLNDSTSSGVEHKKDCGIFENNQCECSYRTSGASMQNSVGVSELVPKDEKIDHGVVEPPVQLKELDKDGKYIAETISTCKVDEYKEKLLSKTNVCENRMAPPKPRRSSGHERFKASKSMTEEEMCEYDFRFERTSNSPRESVSDVSSVTHRDDASSSSEIPERKIFHQKRSASNKRPSISSPTAFSAENESSVYAFKPDPPSSSNRPFRRGRGKSGDLDDGKQPSSSSIAVQVNLETESVLESSTQTERANDDNDGHLFYIPLPDEQLQSGVPHGVAVKLDTEGPDQRVIMRAKLVTKPSTSNALLPSPTSRGLVTSSRSNHQKPEQKVRPLWGGRAVGTVPPTLREPQTNDQGTTTAPEKPRLGNQVAQSSQSTQISQSSPKAPDSPRSRSLTKAQKSTEIVQPSSPPTAIEWKGTEFPPPDIPPTLVEAPTFYPDEKDFQDPLEYIEKLTPLAQSFGICRIVPPSSFKPECKVSDDMRFTAYNQYVHKMMERWGPNVRELCAIKKYLATQSITLIQLPMIGSMEVDLPRLYQTVQQCGGLKEVIEKKRWARVADLMRIPKSAQDRVTKLDDIYCKYLLPYDTLSHAERTKLLEEVDEDWKEREEKRLASDEESGNNGSGEGSDESSEPDDNIFECITKGKNMPLSVFFRIARNTMATWFKDSPSPSEVETEFWRHVSNKTCHVCVHCGSIDSGTWGYGFPTTKTSATSRHPWNLKVLTNSPGSILRSLGPIMGVTVPTLHVGMLFSSCCWYRDPHALPWIEYLHTGASKLWYGVPDSRANELRKAMYPLLPRHIRDRKIWLPSDTMMVPPQFLLDGGVSLCRVVQEPGQFILVFPKAFTSSICTGYVVSESVYFAQPSWLNSAVQVFKDIQDSCEPPVFSLHKLLFNIANDSRSSADILIQVLPMLKSVIEKEVESRKKLEGLGLDSWERLPSNKSGRRKKKEEDQGDLECDTCRGALFLSVVTNSNEDCSYCIDHAIEALSKDESLVKCCKPMYAYDEEEMEDLTDKVKTRIEAKTQKKQKEKGASSGSKN